MKFNPTKENLNVLVKSLRLQDIEYLMKEKLLDCSLDNATRYEFVLTCEGIDTAIRTTGHEFLKARGISMRNLRGQFIREGM